MSDEHDEKTPVEGEKKDPPHFDAKVRRSLLGSGGVPEEEQRDER